MSKGLCSQVCVRGGCCVVAIALWWGKLQGHFQFLITLYLLAFRLRELSGLFSPRFSLCHCPLNCCPVCPIPFCPIACGLVQPLSFLPWNTAGKEVIFFKATSTSPFKNITKIYTLCNLRFKKKSDEKQQTKMKRKPTKKGEEINRRLAEITNKDKETKMQ